MVTSRERERGRSKLRIWKYVCVSGLVVALCTPWTVSCQAALSMGFSRQDTLLQGIFLTQGLNQRLQHCRQVLYHLSYLGSTRGVRVCTFSHIQLFATSCSPPASSVHGISQARLLEWVAFSYSRGSSRPRDRTLVYCIISCIDKWIPLCHLGSPRWGKRTEKLLGVR